MDVIKANKIIAEWLGWKQIEDKEWLDLYWVLPEEISSGYNVKSSLLKFHSDSNWQWLCLEKIAEIRKSCINEVIPYLNERYYVDSNFYTKQDLFEAIYNYVLNERDEN